MLAPGKNLIRPDVESRSNALNPQTGKNIQTGPPSFKRFFVVKQFDGDYLLCVDKHSKLYSVALPFALQESTLYGDGGPEYTYGELVAVEDDSGDEISWSQERSLDGVSQQITPPYTLGEPIFAMHFVNDKDPTVRWIDVNTAGRSWSSPSSTSGDHIAAFKFFRALQTEEFKKGEWVLNDEELFVLQDDLPNPYLDEEIGAIVIPEDITDDTRTDFVWAVSCGSSVASETLGSGEYFVPDEDDDSDGSKPFIAITLEEIFTGFNEETLSEFKYTHVWKKSLGIADSNGVVENYMESVPFETLFTQLALLTDVELSPSVADNSAMIYNLEDKKWKDVVPIILTPVDGIPAGADGIDGLDGEDGADSTVPGPTGPKGDDGEDGYATVEANGGIELNGSGELFLTTPASTGGIEKASTGALQQTFPTDPSATPLNPATIATATEAAYTSNTWTAGTTGVSINIHVRDGFFDAGNEILYGYRRLFTWDKYGRLYSIADEERYVVNEPEVL